MPETRLNANSAAAAPTVGKWFLIVMLNFPLLVMRCVPL